MLYGDDDVSNKELWGREGNPAAPPNMPAFGSVVGGVEPLLVLDV